MVPEKMSIFISKLKEINEAHAEKIEQHYNRYLRRHSCGACQRTTDNCSAMGIAGSTVART